MRINWPVVAVLAAAVASVAVIAPDVLTALVPVLVVLACPVSMLLMARSMSRTSAPKDRPDRDDRTRGGGS